jgi:hypothetical protein
MAGVAAGVIVFVVVGVFGIKLLANVLSKKDDSAQVIRELKQIFPYLLPSEPPTVATVADISKLSGQEFFRNAQNGDKVLVFSVAKVAIIYRRGQRAIINFGPTTSQTAAAATPLVTPPVTPEAAMPTPMPTLTPRPSPSTSP